MPSHRDRIEQQISRAKAELTACEAQLKEAGVEGKACSKNPKWRQLDATHRQLKRRLMAAAAIEKREADAAERKAAALSGSED